MDNIFLDSMGRLPFLIKDGGLSTEIESHGHSLDGSLWSARLLRDNPDAIALVHREFLEAGADCILTASYQASIEGFMREGLSRDESQYLISLSVDVARQERDLFCKSRASRNRPHPLVGGSAGSYGAFLADGAEYRGNFGLSIEELISFHRERAALLLDAGADFLAFETIPCLDEGIAIARMMQDDFPKAQSWIAFSARDNALLNDNTPFSDVLKALEPFTSVQAIGINCSAPDHIAPLLAHARNSSRLLVAYPNSGKTYDAACGCWHGDDYLERYSVLAREWYDNGARIIGGCCRTGEYEIKALTCLRDNLVDGGSRTCG